MVMAGSKTREREREKTPAPTGEVGASAAGLGVTPAGRKKKVMELVVSAERFGKLIYCENEVRYDYEEVLDFLFEDVVRPLLEEMGYEVEKYEKFVHASTISARCWSSPDFEKFREQLAEKNPRAHEELAYALSTIS